jgi:hypothetical protein
LENDELKSTLYEIAPEFKVKVFEETGDIDSGYEIPGKARYRANFFKGAHSRAAWSPSDFQNLRGLAQRAGTRYRTDRKRQIHDTRSDRRLGQ